MNRLSFTLEPLPRKVENFIKRRDQTTRVGEGSLRQVKERLAAKGLFLGMNLDGEDYEEDA